MNREVRPLSPFGVEISNFRIAEATDLQIDDILKMIVDNRVVVFRNQTVSDMALVAFMHRCGKPMFTVGETPVKDASELNIVSNVGRTTPPRSVFHTDTSYVKRPPSIGILKSVLIPYRGGCTLFSDQISAASRLPKQILTWLTGRTIEHSAMGNNGRRVVARHPALRQHPESGQIALFLSTPERCSGLSGVDEMTSKRVIAILYKRSIRTASLYRHVWQPGDIVCWDNRSTMHRADHVDVFGDRLLHRGLILGEKPRAA